MLSAPVLLPVLLAFAAGDPVVVVRDDFSQKLAPHQILVHPPAGAFEDTLGPPITSDLKFQNALGEKPTAFVFPADVDGDGADEIVHARVLHTQQDDLRVRVFAPPFFLDGNTGKALASSKKGSLGAASGDGRIVLMTGGDWDGDGRDEAYVVREFESGAQTLEIRRLPKKKNKSLDKVLAEDATFGTVGSDHNHRMCAADTDGDGRDEVVVVRRDAALVERLLVFDAPAGPLGETGPAIASYADLAAADAAETVSIGRLALEGENTARLAVLRRSLSASRLEVFAFPSGLDAALGAALFTDAALATTSSTTPPSRVFGIQGYHPAPPPPPPANLAGTYQGTFTHTVEGESESIPALDAIPAVQGGGLVSFLMPVFNPLSGVYSQKDAALDFTAVTAEIKDPGSPDSWLLSLGVADVKLVNGDVVIQGTYTGSKVVPGPQQPKPVTGGVYELRRQ